MRRIINAEVSQHTIKLQQLGAKVDVINSTLCYVNFDIGGFVLQYVYNINKKGNYFLERIKPYPLPLLETKNEKDIVKIIRDDIKKFRNALKSHNIESFIEIGRLINRSLEHFENLFLNYNVPKEKIDKMLLKIQVMDLQIELLQESSSKISFDEKPKLP